MRVSDYSTRCVLCLVEDLCIYRVVKNVDFKWCAKMRDENKQEW